MENVFVNDFSEGKPAFGRGKSERVPTTQLLRARLPFVTRPDSTHNRRFRRRFLAAAAAQEQKQINDLLRPFNNHFVRCVVVQHLPPHAALPHPRAYSPLTEPPG